MTIKPTVGRVILYSLYGNKNIVQCGLISAVHNEGTDRTYINIAGCTPEGYGQPLQLVPIANTEEEAAQHVEYGETYAYWMPYQLKVAEEAEKNEEIKRMTPTFIQPQTDLSFSDALILIKQGMLVARKGWNGKKMFIFLVNGSRFQVNRAPLNEIFPEGTHIDYHAHIDMRTATGEIVPWLASQSDVLAHDWEIVLGPKFDTLLGSVLGTDATEDDSRGY